MKKVCTRALAVILCIAMSFGVLAVSGAAADDMKMSIRIEMLHKVDGSWKQSSVAVPGESVKVRVYIGTDFVCFGSGDLPFFYDRAFFEDSYASGGAVTLGDIYKANPYRFECDAYSDAAAYSRRLVSDGQITSAENTRYCCLHATLFGMGSPAKLDGSKWLLEFDLKVKSNATGTGTFGVLLSTVACAANASGAFNLDNEKGISMAYWGSGWDPKSDLTLTNGSVTAKDPSAPDHPVITFDANSGTFSDGKTTKTATLNYADPVSFPAAPRLDGAEFAGWYNASDSSKTLVSATGETAKNNTTYLAKWRYTVTYLVDKHDGRGEVSCAKQSYFEGDRITPPTFPKIENYEIDTAASGIPAVMPAQSITVSLVTVYVPPTYYAEFIADGKTVKKVPYTEETVSITAPAVPAKEGNTGEWEEYTLKAGGVKINAVYTPKVYKATWMVGSEVLAVTDCTFGESLIQPRTPVKEYQVFSGWNPSVPKTMPAKDMTFTAVYEPRKYTAVLMADGKEVDRISYSYGQKSISLPKVPEKAGYTGTWESYSLVPGGITVNAVYSPVTYYAEFVAGGKTVARLPYTVENASVEAPAVPEKAGCTGAWEAYELTVGGVTVHAVYSIGAEITIRGYRTERTEKYKTTITFTAQHPSLPEGSVVEWTVNGETKGTGESFTVSTATADFTVSCRVVLDGDEVAKSQSETVKIKHGFFDKIIAFFKGLFKKLPVIVQGEEK